MPLRGRRCRTPPGSTRRPRRRAGRAGRARRPRTASALRRAAPTARPRRVPTATRRARPSRTAAVAIGRPEIAASVRSHELADQRGLARSPRRRPRRPRVGDGEERQQPKPCGHRRPARRTGRSSPGRPDHDASRCRPSGGGRAPATPDRRRRPDSRPSRRADRSRRRRTDLGVVTGVTLGDVVQQRAEQQHLRPAEIGEPRCASGVSGSSSSDAGLRAPSPADAGRP